MLFSDLVEVLSQGCLKPDVACRKPLVYGLKGVAEIQTAIKGFTFGGVHVSRVPSHQVERLDVRSRGAWSIQASSNERIVHGSK